jgi:hypothetical protein
MGTNGRRWRPLFCVGVLFADSAGDEVGEGVGGVRADRDREGEPVLGAVVGRAQVEGVVEPALD